MTFLSGNIVRFIPVFVSSLVYTQILVVCSTGGDRKDILVFWVSRDWLVSLPSLWILFSCLFYLLLVVMLHALFASCSHVSSLFYFNPYFSCFFTVSSRKCVLMSMERSLPMTYLWSESTEQIQCLEASTWNPGELFFQMDPLIPGTSWVSLLEKVSLPIQELFWSMEQPIVRIFIRPLIEILPLWSKQEFKSETSWPLLSIKEIDFSRHELRKEKKWGQQKEKNRQRIKTKENNME